MRFVNFNSVCTLVSIIYGKLYNLFLFYNMCFCFNIVGLDKGGVLL